MDYLFLAWMVAYALLMLLFALWQRGTGIGGGKGFTGDSAVDVIIPHRNERDALPALLECLRLQEGAGSFRILLVDDHSEDGGGTLADASAAQWEAGRLLSLHLGAGASGKKAALALGLQHSRAELVLFTDADVQLPPAWVAVYRQAFGAHPGVVLWCGPVRVGPGRGFWGALQYLEYGALMLAAQASLSLGWPLLASGASMGIRRAAFVRLGPDPWKAGLSSGDDVYLLYNVWEKYGRGSAAFLWNPRVLVATGAEPGLEELLRQRARWAGKTLRMKGMGPRLTGGLTTGANLFPGLAALALTGGWISGATLLIGIGIKVLADLGLALAWARFTRLWRQIWLAPLVSLIYPVVLLAVALAAFSKNTTWKGRKINKSID